MSRPAAYPSAIHRVPPRSVPQRAPPCPAPQRSPTFPPCPAPQLPPACSPAFPSFYVFFLAFSSFVNFSQRSFKRMKKISQHPASNSTILAASICAFRFPREVRFTGAGDLYPCFSKGPLICTHFLGVQIREIEKNRGTDQPLNHNLICTSPFLAFSELRSENSRKTGVQIKLICTLVLRKNRGTDQLFTADLGALEKNKKLICTPIFCQKRGTDQ